jgi:hypothetical protein
MELQAWIFNVYSIYRSWESRGGFADWSENWVWAVVGAAVVNFAGVFVAEFGGKVGGVYDAAFGAAL